MYVWMYVRMYVLDLSSYNNKVKDISRDDLVWHLLEFVLL